MEHRDRQILEKIDAEAREIAGFIRDFTFEQFQDDERTKRAVSMTLINIGELVKGLSEGLRLANPSIPWRAITGLRDVTAHRYQTLRMEDIWETVTTDLPVFHNQIIGLLSD